MGFETFPVDVALDIGRAVGRLKDVRFVVLVDCKDKISTARYAAVVS